VAGLVLLASSLAAPAQETPAETDYTEKVEVRLIQLEVTVWPSNDRFESCSDLVADDFELLVNGKRREDFNVDPAGSVSAQAAEMPEEPAPAEAPEADPFTLVLFFDLWHLNLFHPYYYACGATLTRAFDQARRMVREVLEPGDRVLLVTFAGWPRVHEGWIDDPETAIEALDRLEVSPAVLGVYTEHVKDDALIEGLNSLFLALGRSPGRKEVLYLADDFRFDDLAVRMLEMAGRAQANRVTVNSVDLVTHCRKIGCDFGGLGCTEYRSPLGIGPIAAETGGRLFTSGNVVQAVESLRAVQGCRYVVSFPYDPARAKRKTPRTTVRLNKKGLSLRAPASFQNPERPPKEREEQDALFLLPRFGSGLTAEVGLWPLRPGARGKRWRAMMIARLRREPGVEWPEGLSEIVLDAAAHQRSRIYGEFRKVIAGAELAALRDLERGKLFAFPIEDVRPGEATVVVRAQGTGTDVAANVRATLTVPNPPGPGEARPWFIADRLARVGDEVTLLPSMDAVLPVEAPAMLVGYGCQRDPGADSVGALVARETERRIEVPIGWFEPPQSGERGAAACGWLIGDVSGIPDPGVWRFEPPASLAYPDDLPPIELRIEGQQP
jgi:VWFA-related protein